jgi:hypothetical protein
MNLSRFTCSLATALLVAWLPVTRAADEATPNTIKFSDPAKPGTLKVILARGDVRIHGADTAEIKIQSDSKPATRAQRKDGLRVLSSATSYSLGEKDNVITLDATADGWSGGSANFAIDVPRNTSVNIQSSWGGGNIQCADVTGDLEINCTNGEVRLDGITGGAVVSSMNGRVHATVREVHDGKPLSFQSMNGEIDVRVPADAKANVRFRTQNGTILTDFDDKQLVTKTEAVPGKLRIRSSRTPRASTGDSATEIHEAVHEAVRTGAEAMREGMAAAREAMQAAREAIAEDRDRDIPTPPMPPMAPMPPIPPVSGGKLVSGALNGGGPEISIATMNGDVKFQKLEQK